MLKKSSIKVFSTVHTLLYRASGGVIGSRMAGMPILLLTATGRRSGKGRTVPLGYLRDGADYVLIGSNAGQDEHPGWILNLRANPQATVQIGRARVPVVTEEADSERRSRLWAELVGQAPVYEGYRKRTAQEILVVILEPRITAGASENASG